MAWLYVYRLGSLVLATCLGLVAFALSAQGKAAENNLVKSATLVVYSSMGIATDVFTLNTMPIICRLVAGFVTGGLVFSDPNVAQFKKVPTCDPFSRFLDLSTICKGWQPITALSIATAVIRLLYTLILLSVAVQKAIDRRSIWTAAVMDSEKPAESMTGATA